MKGRVLKSIFDLVVFWAKHENVRFKCSAISTLAHLFIRQPPLFMEKEIRNILKNIFEPNTLIDIKNITLQMFADFLIAEEKKLEYGN